MSSNLSGAPLGDDSLDPNSSRAGKSKEGSDPPAKPKITKSRNGCITCKAKRLKCDETKPTCLQCKKRNVECGGYKKDFKWKSFEESSFMKSGSRRKGSASDQTAKSKEGTTPLPAPATPTASNSSFSPATSISASSLVPPSISTAATSPARQPQSPMERTGSVPFSTGISTNLSPSFPASDRSGSHSPTSTYFPSPVPYSMFDPNMGGSHPANAILQGLPVDISRPSLQPSPLTSPHEQAYPGGGAIVRQDPIGSGDAYSTHSVPTLQVRSMEGGHWQPYQDVSSYFEHAQSPHSTRSMSGHSLQSVQPESAAFQSPHRAAAALLSVFANDTCSVISMKKGEENPWCKHVLPMARSCPPLMHAILALTAFRASARHPETKPQAIENKAEALRHLGRDMSNMPPSHALATTLALSIAEAFDSSQKLPHNYLAMNRALVRRMLDELHHSVSSPEELERASFILNTWLYFDVMSSVTSKTHQFDGSIAHEVTLMTRSWGYSPPVDSSMGIAASLFPFIGRVANLVRLVRNSQANDANILAEAENLKRILTRWGPIHSASSHGLPEEDVDDFKCTSEAFRWAALLLLHQAVPEISLKASVQMASRILKLLAAVPPSSSCLVFQIFPLLVAGCDADDERPRGWVMRRWQEIGQRLQVEFVARCIELTQEVWRRRDGISAGPSRRASQADLSSFDVNYAGSGTSLQSQYQMQGLQQTGHLVGHTSDAIFDQALGQHLLAMQTQQPIQPLHSEILSEEDILRILSDAIGYDMEKGATDLGAVSLPRQSPEAIDMLPFEQTVRGSQNWLGVMDQWGWELWIA